MKNSPHQPNVPLGEPQGIVFFGRSCHIQILIYKNKVDYIGDVLVDLVVRH